MTDYDRLEQRLAAVERTVVDGEFAFDELPDRGSLVADLERLESRLDAYEYRVATLEGETEALRGFVDRLEAVNSGVEREATTALLVVDRLERRLDALEDKLGAPHPEVDDEDDGESDRTARESAGSSERRSASRADRSIDCPDEDIIGEIVGDSARSEDADSSSETGRTESVSVAGRTASVEQRAIERRLSSTDVGQRDRESVSGADSAGFFRSLVSRLR
ncbi:DUF7310 family coiled-coil domain-containing protein [Natrarchaeobius oligotrophus]|uniref:DUF7310 domain-containing protein n=1 Tax=Natrarchaeobius chitinivorans TaxID=1679083 RepID=A0A3N6MJ72_NATCH|nr:hypothetical protein [Natrarchaeobius chitinivorans]RQH01295.1 hypothetical protein EA472_07530 [Natrarchaeobius chitinivorans]